MRKHFYVGAAVVGAVAFMLLAKDLATPQPSQPVYAADDSPIALGDTAEQVKAVLKTKKEPVASPRRFFSPKAPIAYGQELHREGVTFFYDGGKRVINIGVEHPVRWQIGGIRVNDGVETLLRIRGKPARINEERNSGGYWYLYYEVDRYFLYGVKDERVWRATVWTRY